MVKGRNASPHLLRIAGAVKGKVLTGPRLLRIDIANKCNLRCPYCWYYGEGAEHEQKKDFDFSLFKQIVDDAADLDVEEIELSGEGEPFLHPKIKEMIDYIHNKKKFRLFVNTNGTFTKSMYDILPKVYQLRVNLPAFNKKSYISVHGEKYSKNYKRILTNLVELSKNQKVHLMEIIYIVHKKNYRFIPEFIDFANKLNPTSIRINMTSGFSRLNREEKEELAKILGKTLKNPLKKPNNLKYLYEDLISNPERSGSCGKKVCYIGYEEAMIATNGDAGICCKNRCIKIGNVHENPFKDIWNSREYQKIRDFTAKGFEPAGKWDLCRTDCEAEVFNSEMRKKVEKLKSTK